MNDKKFDTHEKKSEPKIRLMSYNNTHTLYISFNLTTMILLFLCNQLFLHVS